MKLRILLSIILGIGLAFLYQNCAPSSGGSNGDSQVNNAPVTPGQQCDSQIQPSPNESIDCPAGSSGTGALRSRSVVCQDQNWISSSWSNLNFENCTCDIPSQIMDPLTGLCSCPTGQILSNHQCVPATCNDSLKPLAVEIGSCPSGMGQSFRARTVTCDSSNQTWTTSAWNAWDYSQCACALPGQTVNAETGVCNCPEGQTEINNACYPVICNPGTSETLTESALTCPNNTAGVYNRNRLATCDSANNQWVYSDWVPEYNTCSCPLTGQVFNLSTLSCQCPEGQILNGQKCVTANNLTCPFPEPANEEYQSCPSNIGVATRSRIVTCVAATSEWKIINGNWDYSACGCAVQGAIVDMKDGSCSCPTGTALEEASQTCVADPPVYGCPHPDHENQQVKVGKKYTYYTITNATSKRSCDESKYTLSCLASGEWSGVVPETRYKTCQPKLK